VRIALVLLALAACSDKPSSTIDAAGDGMTGDVGSSCEGPCKLTNVALMFASNRSLDSAYYGTTFDSMGLHVEAYRNAASGCPTGSSQTPDYTLVLREVAPTQPTSPMATANILDFKGDLLGGPLGLAATMKQISTAAYEPGNFVALDVDLTFSSGTAVGHIYATHCATLDM
jgi:hypothetical protein